MSEYQIMVSGLMQMARIMPVDVGDDGSCVWSVRIGSEERWVEGWISDNAWNIVDLAAKAYEDEGVA